jgi:predicted enzyme related to lactoylglutathione lyase
MGENRMSEAASHAPGVPSWVDLGSPDLEASKVFYAGLFGWEAFTVPAPEAGGYTMFLQRGKHVSAMGPNGERPPSWMTYIATADADATTAKVRAAGGTVLVEPLSVMDAGRMAVYLDPTGAAFSVWQAGDHHGAELVNEPGAFCWNELQTRDVDAAKRFYGAVFGWGSETHEGPMQYTEWKHEGRSIGGMMDMAGHDIPAAVPAHWLVYFGAGDCDATTARARELGGTVVVPPMDIPDGLRFSVVSDPQGAIFGILRTSR